MDKILTTIQPKAPFDFDLTAGYHTYFRGHYGTDSMTEGVYRRLLDLPGYDKQALVSVTTVGTVERPELAVEVRGEDISAGEARAATRQVAWLLGADQDPAPFYALAREDPVMSGIVDRLYGLHLPHTSSVFEALTLAIMGQQIATGVARIIRTLFIETYGLTQSIDGEIYYAFPRPETVMLATIEDLRKLKLSQRKAEYIQGIAGACADGSSGLLALDRLADDEVVDRVMQLRGVGQWTAQWALIRGLGRADAFPSGDLALRRVVSRLYFQNPGRQNPGRQNPGRQDPDRQDPDHQSPGRQTSGPRDSGRRNQDVSVERLEEFSQRWRPWRTFATVYLFTALRLGLEA